MRQYCLKAEVICSDEGKSLVNALHNTHCIPLLRVTVSHTKENGPLAWLISVQQSSQYWKSFFDLIFCSLNGVTTLAVKGKKGNFV